VVAVARFIIHDNEACEALKPKLLHHEKFHRKAREVAVTACYIFYSGSRVGFYSNFGWQQQQQPRKNFRESERR